MSATKPTVEKVTSDSEEDLDDLDDVLSQFTPGQSSASLQAPLAPLTPTLPPATQGRPRNNTRVDLPPKSVPGSSSNLAPADEGDEDALSSEFAKELAKGMESLMREIAGGEGTGAEENVTEEERERAFKAAWEAMLVEGMDGNIGEGGLEAIAANDTEPKGAATAGGFQDTIKQAMDKMKASESKIQDASGASGAGAAANPDSIEALLASLGDLGLGEGEDETELAGFLESMMGQLMSKQVLYEPLKELADGFPPFLANPPAPISAEDRQRYDKQLVCVRKILTVFEKPGFSDTNAEDNQKIVDLMSEMQTYGTPPSEIMGPLPAGLDGAGGIPGLGEEGCTIA